ncbi:MAG: hypothetical protein LBT50_07270 [Prevotellaceae bacterium]|jgi:hypothetical protein|nr:hypothetical protein [Prevotellaceae bacterium]
MKKKEKLRLSVQSEQTLAEKEMDSLKKEIFVGALATGKITAVVLPLIIIKPMARRVLVLVFMKAVEALPMKLTWKQTIS